MKLLNILLFFAPLFIFSREDTLLYKKKFNLILGIDLSIPQHRNDFYYEPNPSNEPNVDGNNPYRIHHVTKTIYNSSLLKNALNLSLNAEIRLMKKLYLQTSLNVICNFERNSRYSDSLYLSNGTWGTETISKITIYNFLIPIGVQYRFNNRIFASIGGAANVFTIKKEREMFYSPQQWGTSKSSSSNLDIFPSLYIASNFRIIPRTFLNLKISNNLIINYGFTIYYSIGLKFLII